MNIHEIDELIKNVTPEKAEAAWEKALVEYGEVYAGMIKKGHSERLASQLAMLKADATFLSEVHK